MARIEWQEATKRVITAQRVQDQMYQRERDAVAALNYARASNDFANIDRLTAAVDHASNLYESAIIERIAAEQQYAGLSQFTSRQDPS